MRPERVTSAASSPGFAVPPENITRISFRHALRYLGPGAIIASVTIGAGELVWASRGGAIFGYGLLWCFLYAGVFKAMQVYTGVRHLTLTGEHPLRAWCRMPGPRGWFPILLLLPAIPIMPLALSTIAETLGTFIHSLLGLAVTGRQVGLWGHNELFINLWGTGMTVVCFGVYRISSYTLLERLSLAILGALIVLIGVSVVASGPSISGILSGLLVPHVPDYPGWLLTDPRYAASFSDWSPWIEVSLYLLAVGGGTQDYLGYVGVAREKCWGLAGGRAWRREQLAASLDPTTAAGREQIRRARLWLRAPLLDTAISFAAVILVTLLFAILGASLLNPLHAIPHGNDLLTVQETFLTRLHPMLSAFYRIAVFLALGGTLYGLFPVFGASITEGFDALAPNPHDVPLRACQPRWMKIATTALFVTTLTVVWLPAAVSGDIVTRLAFATVIGGATSTGFWLLAMLWLDRSVTVEPLRMPLLLRVMVFLSAAMMMVLGVRSIVAFFG